ncbi:hypothetical protein ACOMHN_037712 [Nucella lapillus]
MAATQGWSFLPKMGNGKNDCESSDRKNGSKEEDKKLEAPDENAARISRGPRPELSMDFDKLKPLCVYDEHGKEIPFMELFRNQKTIVIFIRHFLDFIAKEYVEDLAIIPEKYLQDANVRLVIIGPSLSKFITPFKTLTNCRYNLYCDPDREVYKAMGLHEKVGFGQLKKSKHVKSGTLMGVLQSVWRAMQSQEYQGNTKQQGGAFILGPGERVLFIHQDDMGADHVSINDLLAEAGVQPVSFPKDQRAFTV